MWIRKAKVSDAAGIAKVSVDTWRTTYRGVVSDRVLAGLAYEKSEKKWDQIIASEKDIVFVAENHHGDIIGYANGGKERRNHAVYEGELYALYLLQDYQKRGIGKQLLSSIASELAEWDIRTMFVWVLEQNPSRYFYEALGGKEVDETSIVIGGTSLKEIGYGWDDTSHLLR